jgi:U3 small nucleolar RNA-associated protein 13
VHGDQNILFHSLSKRTLSRQFIGFNDEIVDATFIKSGDTHKKNHLAVATNSSLIRIYDTSTFDARLLEGHREIVLCLDRSADSRLLASGSKDSSARLWAPCQTTEQSWEWGWVAICDGHAESVGAIALSRQDNDSSCARFMFTGSQDRTIKMWDVSNVPNVCERGRDVEVVKCKSLFTLKAHDKDINSLDVAPNDRLLASGSQDRTAKVYEIDYSSNPVRGSLKLVGTCVGHKRGVWCVRFGKHEKVLATASGDKSVKLWSLSDYSCLKTFEGHGNSVLRVDFLSEGSQMVSCGSDGLVKVWNVRTEECVVTMDNHEDKVYIVDMITLARSLNLLPFEGVGFGC